MVVYWTTLPQTRFTFGCDGGCRAGNSRVTNPVVSRTPLESGAIERDSRVGESDLDSKRTPEPILACPQGRGSNQ
jgi:hypothetical protein